MPSGSIPLAPLSPAASSARRLSTRATEELLRRVLAQVAAAPATLPAILGGYSDPLIAFTAGRTIIRAN
jgi:hypothetical protein